MTGDIDHETRRRMLTKLAEALRRGDGAVVVIAYGGGDEPHHLQMIEPNVSTWTTKQVAEYLLELTVARIEAAGGDAAPTFLPHLRDALLSLKAAEVAPDHPVVGHG